jgi:hypothetical protein
MDVSKVLGIFGQMLMSIFAIGCILNVPGARWPGAAIAKAFMTHGFRPSLAEVEIIVKSDVMWESRCNLESSEDR